MRLTRNGKVPYHIIAPFEQVSHLKAFILPANNRSYILVREVVQCASVSQWFVQARTGLHVATKEVAVKLLLTRGQIHRRHGVGSPSRPSRSVEECGASVNSQEISGVDAGRNPQEYNNVVELQLRSASTNWKLNRHWLGTYSTLMAIDGLRCIRPGSIVGTIG